MTNTFCPRLSHQLEAGSAFGHLTVAPCCRYKPHLLVRSAEEFADARARLEGTSGWTPACDYCHAQERAGIRSYRQEAFDSYPQQDSNQVIQLTVTTDQQCNAACLSCDAGNSSTWASFNSRHGIPNLPAVKQILDTVTLSTTAAGAISDSVRTVAFVGGEPFYSRAHKEWLKLLIARADPSKIRVKYITNGSILPDSETEELWQQFEAVNLLFSVDGVGDQFHYLRWPLTWHKFTRTVDHFLDHPRLGTVMFNCTVGVMNLLSVAALADWVEGEFMPRYRGGEDLNRILVYNPCRGVIGLDKITPVMRNHYRETQGNDPRFADLTRMVNSTKLRTPQIPAATVDYVQTMDRLRNLDWQHTFPELKPYFP